MKKIAKFIVRIRYVLTVLFFVLVGVCGYFSTKVNINYDMFKYLDQNSESTVALNQMIEDFGAAGSASVMVKHVDVQEANHIKATIEGVEGVNSVIFDATNEASYKDSYALYTIYLNTGDFDQASYDTMDNIRDVLSEYDIAATGATVVSQYLVEAADRDMVKILSIACAVVFVILVITSSSWVEPIMFAIIVAGAIVMNLGTNIFMKEISFVTKSIAAVMQLALAMDYSIILLHSYNEEREHGLGNIEAMENALAKSFKPISSSSITTIAGLVALMFMSFSIGFDVGMVLAKGILISLLTVFIFMPGILLIFSPLIEKTKHRNLFEICRDIRDKKPNQKHVYTNFQYKTRIAIPVIVLLLVIAGAVLNFNSKYSYELETSADPNASINVEKTAIEEKFGIQNTIVVLLPKGNTQEQQAILDFMNNYTYKGEHVVTGGQGMITTGLYSALSSQEVCAKLGVSEDVVNSLYENIPANKKDANGKVLLVDILAYLKSNEGQALLTNYVSSLQADTDNKATEYSQYFAQLTAPEMAQTLGFDASIVETLYQMMDKEEASIYELATFIKTNNALVSYGNQKQEEINNQATQVAPLFDDATRAQAQSYIDFYEAIPQMTEGSTYETNYKNYKNALTALDKDTILANYDFLTSDVVDQMFASYGATDTICNYQLVTFLSKQNVLNAYGSKMQEAINSQAEEVAPLFDDTTRAQAEGFIQTYEATPAMAENPEYKAKYESYKKALTALDKDTILANYDFLTSDVVDQMFASYGATDTICNYQLVTFLSKQNILTAYGTKMQEAINSQATQVAPLFDDATRAQAQSYVTLYEAIPQMTEGSKYEEDYKNYKMALLALNKEQILANYSFLTSEAVDQMFASYGATDTICNYQLVTFLSKQNVLTAYGAKMQEAINEKATQLAPLGTDLTKDQLVSGLGLTDSLAQMVLGEEESMKGIDALKKIKNQQLILAYGNTLSDTLDETWDNVEYAYSMFETDTEARMLFNLNMAISDGDSFIAIKEIKDGVQEIEADSKIVCSSYVYSDIKDVFNSDMVVVNLISFFAILVIVGVTFKSWFVPVLLTTLIQGAIWVTMGISTMCGNYIFFVCYLVVMCIQMGATVDYAILLTTKYMENRKTMNKKDSIRLAMESSIMTILTSGSILVLAAFIIGLVSDISIISSLGLLLSRGCLISVLLIIFALPQILMLCDPLLTKSTWHTKFVPDDSKLKD